LINELAMNVLTMNEAKAAGLTRYFTGVACPRGHIAERMVSTRACAECLAERRQAWGRNNPQKVTAQKRAWRNANIEKSRRLNLDNQKKNRASANKRSLRWYHEHRDQAKAATARWQREHPDAVASKAAKYRAAKSMQMPGWADEIAIGMMYQAANVFRVSGFDVHVDHVIPLQGRAVAGLHVHRNLQIIDALANRSKSNRI
jgi:hypothetical protein